MAFRTWVKAFFATLGVGALTAAGELGMAYGLGIVRLTRVVDVTARDQWTAQLAWVTWFPMVAAVVGAVAGARMLRRWAPGSRGGVGTELALSFAAAIGAAAVVPLTMQPARTAQVAGVDAVVVIAICTGIGALVGVFAAWGALAQAVARWSLAAMSIVIGVLALVSVAPSLAPSDPLPAVRLGVLDATFLPASVTQRTALATMPALALVIGVLLGWVARRRELPTLTIALAGLPGPALLTVAYLIAGPGSSDDRYQMTPYWAAMTATGAGVLGSVLAAVLRRPVVVEDEEPAGPDNPTPDRPPLPRRPEQKESAIAAAGSATAGETPLRPADTAVFDTEPKFPEPASPEPKAPEARHSGPPFDGFATAGPAKSAKPYVPEPATRPLPPEVLQPAAGRPGRGTQPGARSRAAEPLVPEPTPVSAPLPEPTPATPLQPANPPRPVSPPVADTTPRLSRPIGEPVTDPATILPRQGGGKNRFGLRRRKDEDYVDWVSGLGN
ncbi:hypothetical protein [Actinoplanes sp. N902-109]|uniref:hypothetical protein n=1 Tax=Actinoplanes sp. (strain N902-109) TaxID=649831 RepID=UPI0006846AB9|nr:hypothetical protein [Actinoplanes sp. N902-109]